MSRLAQGPPSLLSSGYQGHFHRDKAAKAQSSHSPPSSTEFIDCVELHHSFHTYCHGMVLNLHHHDLKLHLLGQMSQYLALQCLHLGFTSGDMWVVMWVTYPSCCHKGITYIHKKLTKQWNNFYHS